MTKRKMTAALVAVALLAASSAQAQDATVENDRFCLAVSVYFSGHKKKELRNYGNMTLFYYLARLQVGAPELATAPALIEYFDRQNEEDLFQKGRACIDDFDQKTMVFKEIGQTPSTTAQ